ncbi:MAG: hypothetical protein AB3N15_04585 [Paracoccaceae bacterium]
MTGFMKVIVLLAGALAFLGWMTNQPEAELRSNTETGQRVIAL